MDVPCGTFKCSQGQVGHVCLSSYLILYFSVNLKISHHHCGRLNSNTVRSTQLDLGKCPVIPGEQGQWLVMGMRLTRHQAFPVAPELCHVLASCSNLIADGQVIIGIRNPVIIIICLFQNSTFNSNININSHQKLKMISTHKFVS